MLSPNSPGDEQPIAHDPAPTAPFFALLRSFSAPSRETAGNDGERHFDRARTNDDDGASEKQLIREDDANMSRRDDNQSDRVFKVHDSLDDDFDIESSTEFFESENGNDQKVAAYAICETIDESMWGLHTCSQSKERVQLKNQNHISYEYDWILDGDHPEDSGDVHQSGIFLSEECHVSAKSSGGSRRRRIFGDDTLDQMLGMMELENHSFSTAGSSCGSFLEGHNASTNENIVAISVNDALKSDRDYNVSEGIDFANFSNFDCNDGENPDDKGYDADWGDFVSVDVLTTEKNLESEIHDNHGRNENADEYSQGIKVNDDEEGIKLNDDERERKEMMIEHMKTQENVLSVGYQPPSSIMHLVSNLDAELDETIEQCLALSPAVSSNADENNLESKSLSGNCTNLPHGEHVKIYAVESDVPKQEVKKNCAIDEVEHKQSFLMSSMLLESLPIPLPTLSLDLMVSFTRRVQEKYLFLKALGREDVSGISGIQAEDDVLEEKLADTIYPGYFCGDGDDSDYFDSIVLDELLNVPWPFDVIDLSESFTDEFEDTGLDGHGNSLNFDSYISNRLSQLDSACGEIMRCILSRVSRKEGSIDDGVKGILAAELDVATALLYAESSREFLHRALRGYPLHNEQYAQNTEYNAILGALDVAHYADHRDRLRYLLETLDQISAISFQEAQWWKDVLHEAKVITNVIPPNKFHKIVEDARRLKDLVLKEEVLNHLVSLHTMRDRINGLPEILLEFIEESLSDLFARILKAEQVRPDIFDKYSVEYETLIRAMISCCQLKARHQNNSTQQLGAIAAEWSGCMLKILCFEVSKAFACSLINSFDDERMNTLNGKYMENLEDIKFQVNQIQFNSKIESDLVLLSHKLVTIRHGDFHSSTLSLAFFHLCSRLVELMILYSVLLQWHEAMIVRMSEHDSLGPSAQDAAEPHHNINSNARDLCQNDVEETDSKHTVISSMSSDKLSSSASFEETSSDESSIGCVPVTFEFKGIPFSNSDEFNAPTIKRIQRSVESIRHPLWKYCESILVELLEVYMSGATVSTGSGELGIAARAAILSAV